MWFRVKFASVPLALLLLVCCGGEDEPASAISSSQLQRSEQRTPNIVLILIDTLRADHLAPYGYDPEVAPFLASLAQQSVVFSRAYSTSSWTAPATASLFTGLYPTHHGLTRGFLAQKRMEDELAAGGEPKMNLHQLPVAIATLPMLLKKAGYATYGMAANINIGPELGFARGFDRFSTQRK